MANKYFRAHNGQFRKAFCSCNDYFNEVFEIVDLKVELFHPLQICPKCQVFYWYYIDKAEEPPKPILPTPVKYTDVDMVNRVYNGPRYCNCNDNWEDAKKHNLVFNAHWGYCELCSMNYWGYFHEEDRPENRGKK
jgi:hypothetical protein